MSRTTKSGGTFAHDAYGNGFPHTGRLGRRQRRALPVCPDRSYGFFAIRLSVVAWHEKLPPDRPPPGTKY